MPTSAGEIYAEMGQHLAEHITKAGADYQKQNQSLEEIQQYLNIAKGIQTNDPKTGKPKNFFSDQQIADIQRLHDMGKARAAGAAEAALGIGKGMVDRIQGGAAREALARQGPIISTVNGVHFVLNPKTMAWQQITAVPRNEIGMTATSQITAQQRAQTAQSKGEQATQKIFSNKLKDIGVTTQQLFDPSVQEHGTFNPDTGFEPTNQPAATPTPTPGGLTLSDISNAIGSIGATDPSQLPQGAAPTPTPTPVPSPTHVRVGYQPMQVQPSTDPKKPGKIIDKGKPGSVIPLDDLTNYQNAAAHFAGPQAERQLQYLRNSPETSATDPAGNPWTPTSIQKYNDFLPTVQKDFKRLMVTPEARPAQTPSATTAPDRGPTTIQGQPAFSAPPAADTTEDDSGDDSEDQ